MRTVAVIPARYDASRFPGKLMQMLGDETVITRTFRAAVATGLFDDVIVATDSDVIREEIKKQKGTVVMTRSDHESGTDRIAEAISNIDAEIIVNIQGDTPFINGPSLKKLIDLFNDPTVRVASLMDRITENAWLNDPNVVKVCVDKNGDSLLFSRSLIPYPRNQNTSINHFRHIGVYAFRREAMILFTQLPVSTLEDAEKIECLRFLENGIRLRMAITEPIGEDINTPEDLERARARIASK